MENSRLIDRVEYMDSETTPHKHHHLFSELIYVQEGDALFTIDGRQYRAGRGSLLFVSSYEPHEVQVLQVPYQRFFLTVNAARLEYVLGSRLLASVLQNRTPAFRHQVDLSGSHQAVCAMLGQMLAEFQGAGRMWETVAQNLLENLLILTYRACPDNFVQFEGSASGRVLEVQHYIERHFTEELRMAELARKYYVSPSYLSHAFKNQTGYSPKQYVLLNRLSFAKELLETTDFQIGQVAYKAGFGDVNNFIRAFREWYGLSPGSYRSRNG